MTAVPLPEIKEAVATGQIADIYDDIRRTIGVPMVNLVFRNMATVPGCLEWAWAHLAPLYDSGAVAREAAALTSAPELRRIVAAPTPFDIAATDVAAAGRAYARANPMNLLGLGVLGRLLEETPEARLRRPAPTSSATRPAPAMPSPLPPMIDLARAPAATRQLLEDLARQLHQGDNGVIPSLYRHFGHAPAFLQTLKTALDGPVHDGRLFAAGAAMENEARSAADRLYAACPCLDVRPPTAAAADNLRHLIAIFPVNICRMTVVALGLAQTGSGKL